MAVDKSLWVIVNGTEVIEAYDDKDAADLAAGDRGEDFAVQEVDFKRKAKKPAKKSPTKKAAKRSSPVDGEEEGEAAPAKKKTKASPKEPKEKKEVEIPIGMAAVFSGVSFAIIGSTKLNREVLTKCIENHSGTVSKKLDEVDYIIKGKAVGEKQKEDLGDKATITEEDFLIYLRTGELRE